MPGIRFSFSPRIFDPFMSSTSDTAGALSLRIVNVIGPAGSVAGAGAHPALVTTTETAAGVPEPSGAAPELADEHPVSRPAAASPTAARMGPGRMSGGNGGRLGGARRAGRATALRPQHDEQHRDDVQHPDRHLDHRRVGW